MYYSYPCSYCGKVFYTFNDDREQAAQILYNGIKEHLKQYDEDHKEYEFDEDPEIETNQMYQNMTETKDIPQGAYELE